MRHNEKNELAIREALASTCMEGLAVTSDIEKNVRRILSGEITVGERIRQIKEDWGKSRCNSWPTFADCDCDGF